MNSANKKKRRHFHRKVVRHLFKFRYPKIELLILSIVIAYIVFSQSPLPDWIQSLDKFEYVGMFIAGMFYSFGFSGPFAVGYFTSVTNLNIFYASIIGGIGSLLSDMFIFYLIRFSFMDEFERVKKTKPFLYIDKLMKKDLSKRSRRIFLYSIACIIISSPLPDEIGVTMLSGLTSIKPKGMALISFILSTLGIFIWLLVGNKFFWGF